VEVDVQHREYEPEVARNGRLPGQEALHALFDGEVPLVDLVVERDHFVGKLDIAALKGVEAASQRAQDEVRLALERRLELLQFLLKGDSQPNLPVT
jgi:hypothetical protein